MSPKVNSKRFTQSFPYLTLLTFSHSSLSLSSLSHFPKPYFRDLMNQKMCIPYLPRFKPLKSLGTCSRMLSESEVQNPFQWHGFETGLHIIPFPHHSLSILSILSSFSPSYHSLTRDSIHESKARFT